MCDLPVDVQVETNSTVVNNDDPLPLTCTSGRVIIAATAYVGNTSTAKPLAVALADGALVDECTVYPVSSIVGSTPATVHYSLTTCRVGSL